MSALHALTADFQQKIGLALARWQYVETGLFVLVHGFMGTRYEVSSITFFHIKSAENKLSLADKLCQATVPQRVWQGEWRDLRKEISSHIEIRNAIAHFELMLVDQSLPDGKTQIGIALTPHHLDAREAKRGNVKALFAKQLSQAADEWLTCSKRLLSFAVRHIPDWPQRATQLPHGLQLTLETIRNEAMPEAQQPRPPPSQA